MLASGCTEAEAATISGHKIGGKTMLGRYARPERDAAVHAFEKWHAHDFTGRGKVVRLRGVGNA
jgi:hypothetical protein